MSRDDLRLPISWLAVGVPTVGMMVAAALYIGDMRFQPRDNYATKSDVDSLRWEMRNGIRRIDGVSQRLDILILQGISTPNSKPQRDRTGRRP